MQLISCSSCVCSINGWWRHQINTLVMKTLDLLCQSGDIEEIEIFNSRIPQEFHLLRLMPCTQEAFRELSERKCPVMEQLLADDIIEEREVPNDQKMMKHYIELLTGVAILLSGHAWKVFGGTYQTFKLNEDFARSVEGRGITVGETV